MEAYIENDIPIPVNLKFCFEGMEESGSEGLDDLIFEQKDKFLKVVHAWVLHIAKVWSMPSPYLGNIEEQKS